MFPTPFAAQLVVEYLSSHPGPAVKVIGFPVASWRGVGQAFGSSSSAAVLAGVVGSLLSNDEVADAAANVTASYQDT